MTTMTIMVNGVEIGEPALAREVQMHPAPSLEAARQAAAQALVVRELLLQEAHRLAVVPEPAEEGEDEDDALIRSLLDQSISVPEPGDKPCREHYQQNPERYRSPDLYEAAHILFPAPLENGPERDKANRDAAETLAMLQADPRRFAQLARDRSVCPSGAEGGGLGQFTARDMVPEFAAALDTIEPGTICQVPVPTRMGVHVVRLDHREAGRLLPFERVREQIQIELYDRDWRQAVHLFIGDLAKRARIDGVDLSAPS